MRPDYIVGWDIGGAHVKASVFRDNCLVNVIQLPCPLWRGITFLEDIVDKVLSQIAAKKACHAVTMTGEMVDFFQGRDEGVRQILTILHAKIDAKHLYVFAGREGLLCFDNLNSSHYAHIASANWLASAVCASRVVDSALFIDIGSTTTDVLILNGGEVKSGGFSDYDRLVSGELVYTGIVRTPIATITERVYFEGNHVPLMAEIFATTADVYRLTGELQEGWDLWPTADGGKKSVVASARRLARMIGRDLQSAAWDSWIKLADSLREHQLRSIQNACIQQISRLDLNCKPLVIGAGVGCFLAIDVSSRLGLQYKDFSSALNLGGELTRSSDCAPAVSVAMLLDNQLVS